MKKAGGLKKVRLMARKFNNEQWYSRYLMVIKEAEELLILLERGITVTTKKEKVGEGEK